MSLTKTAVFLASRFDEFNQLRALLKRKITDYPVVQLAAIDLNDGNVTHHPPLAQCLGSVRRAEFMILLLGDTYGGQAPHSDKSFTHLEYEEAIREGSGTRVLVFCIGECYRNRRIQYSDDQRLSGWQHQVEENHTLGFFEPDTPLEDVAKEIFDRLLTALYEMHMGNLSVAVPAEADDDLFDSLDDDAALDDSEISTLDARDAQSRGLSLIDDRTRFHDTLQAITRPAAVAALEQREEAHRAIEIGDYGTAVKHLKRAVDIKPLDVMSNYWLAQLYVALGRKELCPSAVELADRAALAAEYDRSNNRAAACKMIAARASRLQEKDEDAVAYARRATELAPRYARAHVELARQLVLADKAADAVKSLEQAFSLYPRSLKEVLADPTFRPIRRNIDAILRQIKDRLRASVQQLLDCERRFATLAGTKEPTPPEGTQSLAQLTEAGRASTKRQHQLACGLVTTAVEASKAVEETVQDFSTAQKESFSFQRPGRLRIISWHVHPGDLIEPEQPMFSYQFEYTSNIREWQWRRRTSARLVQVVGKDGVIVTSESPYLFSHLPPEVEVKGPSTKQKLQAALEAARNELAQSGQVVGTTKQSLSTWQRQTVVPSAMHIALGVLIVLIAIAFGGTVGLMVASVVLGPYSLVKMYKARKAHARQRELLAARYEQALETERVNAARVEEAEGALASLEKRVDEVRTKALQAIELFESVPLRVGNRMFPFPSLFSCETGDVIRCSDAQIGELKSRGERRVELLDDLPDWIQSASMTGNPSGFQLYKVVEASKQRLLLSRRGAYDENFANKSA